MTRPTLLLARLVAGALVAGFSGCKNADGFECGRAVPGTSDVRVCDRTLEVCICATNSCAKKVNLTEKEREARGDVAAEQEQDAGKPTSGLGPDDCETGYRYVEAPFARPELAHDCVPPEHIQLGKVVDSQQPGAPTTCPAFIPDAAPPARDPAPATAEPTPSDAGSVDAEGGPK